MNEGKIRDSIKRGVKLLGELNLLIKENTTRPFSLNSNKFSAEFYSVCQKNNYKDIYLAIMNNNDYDILLTDSSIIQFSMNINQQNSDDITIRYAYYPNFAKVKTYEAFLEEFEFTYEDVGDELMSEYEQSLDEAKINSGICPIRYDYDYRLYDGLNHSISHIHIGHNNEVRIATSKILTPEKFILFVIRNTYPSKWKDIVSNDELLKTCLSKKVQCLEINDNYFKTEEKGLFYLD